MRQRWVVLHDESVLVWQVIAYAADPRLRADHDHHELSIDHSKNATQVIGV
jgi:hypothetical protein